MATLQYLRKLTLAVGNAAGQATDFSNQRCVFSVRRGDFQTPNSCDVRIYNLSQKTANSLTDPAQFTQVAIQAGYEGNFGLIFRGTIKQVRLGRVDARDSYVDITAADGDEAYNFSPMALSLAAGSTPKSDLQAFIRSMAEAGVSQGYAPQFSESGRVRGRVFYGLTRDELRQFAKDNDVVWSIQDGQLTLIPQVSYIPGEVPVISPQTGLLGIPEQTQNGILMRVLLNPSLKIGQRVLLQSNAINQYRYGLDVQSQATNPLLARSIKTSADGTYYVMKADHNGDTRGNDWYTQLTCLAVDATVPPNLASQGAINPSAASIPRY